MRDLERADFAVLARLKWLDLCGRDVTDAELSHLEGLSSLRCLTLDHPKITEDGVKKFEHAHPNCSIAYLLDL